MSQQEIDVDGKPRAQTPPLGIRDRLSRGDSASAFGRFVSALIGLGATPNRVSWFGFLCALAAGLCLARGAGHALPIAGDFTHAPTSWWPLVASLFLLAASVGDFFDGIIARASGLESRYGALLDSTLDRFADLAVFGGCAIYFASVSNLSYVLLCLLGLAAASVTSYVKARGENLTEGLGAGFWQRGERVSCLGVAMVSGHMPIALWILATFPFLTVALRLSVARRKLEGKPLRARKPGLLTPWRYPRATPTYVVFCTAIVLGILVLPWFVPFLRATSDPFAFLLGGS